MLVSGANRHDSMLVEPLLDSMPAIRRGGRGHPRRRPVKLHGDKGYDNPHRPGGPVTLDPISPQMRDVIM